MSKVVELGAHTRMTVDQALRLVQRESPSEVLIISVGSDGSFSVRSSAMSRKDALWLLELAKDHTLNGK